MPVECREIELDGQPVFLRLSGTLRSVPAPVLYVHGIPGDGGDFERLLERSGGIAVDLLGFGRSGKGAHQDFTRAGLGRFLGRVLDALEVEQVRVVAAGWGIAAAAAMPGGRATRAILLAPPSDTALTRGLRLPVLGELLIGSVSRRLFARGYRLGAGGDRGSTPAGDDARIANLFDEFDQGTQRAVLRLLRDAGPPDWPATAAAFDCPVCWIEGERDPWRAGIAQAETFATGHWVWLHEPAAERILELLG